VGTVKFGTGFLGGGNENKARETGIVNGDGRGGHKSPHEVTSGR